MLKDWRPEKVAERHKYMDKAIRSDPVIRDIHRMYQLLDQKSAALFGHVSLMIAACTLMAGSPTDGHPLQKAIFLGSTLLYVVIALMLIRVLNLSMYDDKLPLPDRAVFELAEPDNAYGLENDQTYAATRLYFARSVHKRVLAHKRALWLTFSLTVAVAVAIVREISLEPAAWERLKDLMGRLI